MDRFTKNILMTMIGLVAAMVIGAYLGVFVFKGDMETKYIKVIEEQAAEQHLEPTHIVELDEVGEYVGFSAAGAIGGFIIGYLLPSIFERNYVRPKVE